MEIQGDPVEEVVMVGQVVLVLRDLLDRDMTLVMLAGQM
jgi:hypothetical protein